MYHAGYNGIIYQYTLSTAWDVSTATYASKSKNVSAQALHATGLFINGVNAYVCGNNDNNIYEYLLSSTTSSSAVFSQLFEKANYKNILIYCNGLNGAASYTYPVAFTNTPSIKATNDIASGIVTTLSNTAVTVTGSNSTGFIELVGF
jgi:hypothetical protein